MSPRCPEAIPTIKHVLAEFAQTCRASLSPIEFSTYCRILFFLELCINNYGHRNLDPEERAVCERHYRANGGSQKHFFEVFGARKLLPELDFFARVYVKRDVFTSERVEKLAPLVVERLRAWLVERGYVRHEELEASRETASERTRLRRKARRAARLLAERAVSVDPLFFTESDYIDTDDHPITRVDPGRFWLRVYRTAEPEEIGPLVAPVSVTKALSVGWNLCCALARVQGRWRIVGVDEVYPNLAAVPVARSGKGDYNRSPESNGG